MPLVTIAMPAYNAARTIHQAVDSVLAQSVANIELVVCDDASTDSTRSILAGYNDPRLVVLRSEQNLGAGKARDRAIAHASGDWVSLIDADDAWHPRRLEKLLATAGECSHRIIFDNIMTCHDVDGELLPWRPVRGSYTFGRCTKSPSDVSFSRFVTSRRLLYKPLIPAALIRENKIVHSNRKFAEDIDFLVSLIASGGQLRYIPEALYYYRVTPGSATGRAIDHTLMRQCLEGCLHADEWPPEIVGAFKKKMAMLREDETLYAVRDAIRKGNIGRAIATFLSYPQAVKAVPYRLTTSAAYEWHRLRHGGATR